MTTDPDAFTNLVQFDNLEVVEDTGLKLLTRFEESAGAEALADSSGLGHIATCQAAACPTMEQPGRYANGATFDGDDYLNTNDGLTQFGKGDFSIGVWLKTTGTSRAIVTKSDGDSSWEFYEKSFYLNNLGRPTFVGYGNGYIQSTMAVNDGKWHQVMVVWDYSGSGTAGVGKMYVDGADVTNSSTNYIASNDDGVSHTLRIGRPNFGEAPHYFSGSLDELVVFGRALSPAEVQDIALGRYNVNDLIVPPATDLTYRATVTNTSSTVAAGFLSANTAYLQPEIPSPAVALSFEPDEQIAYFANNLGEGNNISCVADGHCPTAGIDGAIRNGIAFDGLDDSAFLPTIDIRNQTGFSLNFWLWVESIPAATAMILDTASTATGALDVYLNSNGNIVFDVAGSSPTTSNYSFSTNLNQWVHVSFNEGNIFINASQNVSGGYPSAILGPGLLGNSINGGKPFDGRIDELVYYEQNLDDGSNGGGSFNAINDVKNGNYYSDHEPRFLFPLDELISYDGTIFYDNQSNSNHATCTPPACPTITSSGYSGRAITLDGSNDSLSQPGSYTTDGNGEVTVSFYVKLAANPAGNAYIFDTTSGSDVLDMYINSSGQFVAARQEGTHTSTATVPLNQWVQISLTYDKYYSSGLWRYDSRIYFNGTLDSTRNYRSSGSTNGWDIALKIGSGYIGSLNGSGNFFAGGLDEMSLAVSTISFDPPSTNLGYENRADELRSASCNNVFTCPAQAPGRADGGLSLDGAEDFLSLGKVLNPAGGNFSAAVWFKISSYSNVPVILQQIDGNGPGRVWLTINSTGRLSSFLGGSDLAGTTVVSLNSWHHAALTYDGTLRLYLDGNLEASAVKAVEASEGELWLGRHKTDTTRYLNGFLDELLIIPAALSQAEIQYLLDTNWPAVTIPALFESFTAPPITSSEVNGAASISPYATTSQHQFDQEVEAALTLQAQIDYPIVDDNAASLGLFLPFEETPTSNSFQNLISFIAFGNPVYIPATCSGQNCPTAGLRGQVDRAIYFDGLDDYLAMDFTVLGSGRPDIRTLSVWLNGKQGTILSSFPSEGYGLQLDFNRLLTRVNGSNTITALDLPQDEWFHLVVTVDTNDVMTLYLNGVAVQTSTHNDSFLNPDIDKVFIGANSTGQDMYEGFMDDLRTYGIPAHPL